VNSDLGFRPDLQSTALVQRGVTRDGLTQVRRYWAASDPRAVVLVVHGIAEHCGRYEHVARQLVQSGISVVGFDLRGHGESGGKRLDLDSFTQYHDDVEDQLAEVRALGLPIFLLGHSMGGLIVGGYALAGRPQPDWLVLSAPALGLDAPSWLMGPAIALGKLLGNVRIKLPLKLEDLSSDSRVGEQYAADPLVGTRATLGLIGAMVSAVRSTESLLSTWDREALVVHGLADNIVPPAASEAVGARPRVKRLTYATGRHELFNEPFGPEVVSDVLEWMNERL